jgi:2,3-bisphosphoglycerate-independent phosphoglycerate mutase
MRPDPQAQQTADLLNRLILESQTFLQDHPVNQKRIAEDHQPANSLWPWSPGMKPQMKTFQERFGVRGAVITAVDLIKGLGVYAGLDVIPVEGATGLYDTNYEGKTNAGHERNLELKIQCIEDLDRRLVQRILDGLEERKTEAVVAVLPDHPTPIAHGKHTRDPVPVAIRDPRKAPDAVDRFDEESVKAGALGHLRGAEFIEVVMGR